MNCPTFGSANRAHRAPKSRWGIVTVSRSRQRFSSPRAQLRPEIFPEMAEPLYFQPEAVEEMVSLILAR